MPARLEKCAFMMDDLIWLNATYQSLAMDDEVKKRLADIIRKARGDLSQQAFGKRLGVTQGTIRNWEEGANIPKIENLQAIAREAGKSVEELLEEVRGEVVVESSPPDEVDEIFLVIKKMSRTQRVKLIKLIADSL